MPWPRLSQRGWLGLASLLAWPPLLAVVAALAWSEIPASTAAPSMGIRLDTARFDSQDGRSLDLDIYHSAELTTSTSTSTSPSYSPSPSLRPVILALHGGGWCGGSRREIGIRLANALVPRGFDVVSADYSLARPGAPGWPKNLEDALSAVEWVRDQAGDRGWDPRRIVVWGESAGGHLAALIGARSTRSDWEPPSVSAVVAYYAPTDLLALDGPASGRDGPVEQLLGGPARERAALAREASPVFQVGPSSVPMVLVQGRDDLIVPPDQTERMAQALRDACVPCREIVVEGARHGFGPDVLDRPIVPEVLEFLGAIWNDNLKRP